MKLFRIERRLKERPYYDAMNTVVVRANNEEHARKIASENAGDEGAEVWLDRSKSLCETVTEKGPPVVICRDFNAG